MLIEPVLGFHQNLLVPHGNDQPNMEVIQGGAGVCEKVIIRGKSLKD
jgi:hypothetical protein